jgi:hypothetical protein
VTFSINYTQYDNTECLYAERLVLSIVMLSGMNSGMNSGAMLNDVMLSAVVTHGWHQGSLTGWEGSVQLTS